MIYADYLSTAEMHRWILDTDIAWDQINRELALSQPDLLERVRDSALIESYFPLFTPRALDLLWDDVAATGVFSIQLYESYKHFQVFNQYLHAVGYRPIEDEEIVAIRRRNQHLHYEDGTRLLTRYMMSEHFAAHAFFKDARQAREPVLARILHLVSRDEVRHAQFAFDLLDLRSPHIARSIADEQFINVFSGRDVHSLVVHFHLLVSIQIIPDHHLFLPAGRPNRLPCLNALSADHSDVASPLLGQDASRSKRGTGSLL